MQAAFIPIPDTAYDTSYFTSRHSWNAVDTNAYQEHDMGDSSDCGSSSGSSSTLSSEQEGVGLCIDRRKF